MFVTFLPQSTKHPTNQGNCKMHSGNNGDLLDRPYFLGDITIYDERFREGVIAECNL